jgi:signal transduction histidine kinase
MMPELDGFELLRALRSDDGLRLIPVIMLSARAGEEARHEGLAASADDYLVKPFSARDLLARVDAQILRSRERRLEHQQARALAAAKDAAEAANRVKDEFLATLSHELRTPLNAVLGYTKMLRGGVIPAERAGPVLETIERNARLQEKLINDVLDVSRIITGKMRIDIQPVDLNRVIQEALDTVTPAAAAKGIRLQASIDRPAGPVAGDAERLQQVLWNLLSNAIKFTGMGGRVEVRMRHVNSHVEIAVSDTGEGIAPEFLPHLFMRFSQADTTVARAHGGLGLGLAICRHLVEAHGGRIEAHSPGKGLGTTVRIELPLMVAAAGAI